MCFSKVKYGNKQITTMPMKAEGIVMNNWQEIAPDQMWLTDTLDLSSKLNVSLILRHTIVRHVCIQNSWVWS